MVAISIRGEKLEVVDHVLKVIISSLYRLFFDIIVPQTLGSMQHLYRHVYGKPQLCVHWSRTKKFVRIYHKRSITSMYSFYGFRDIQDYID